MFQNIRHNVNAYWVAALLIPLLLVSCNKKDSSLNTEYALLQIDNPTAQDMALVDQNDNQKYLTSVEGQFLDTISTKGIYLLDDGQAVRAIYMEPGFDLKISKTDNGDYFFEGKNADVQEYLQNKVIQNLAKSKEDFPADAKKYKNDLKEYYGELKTNAESLSSTSFKHDELKTLNYEYQLDLLIFPNTYEYLYGKKPELPSDYFADLDNFDATNLQEFKTNTAYKNLVITYLDKELSKNETYDNQLGFIQSIESQEIRETFLTQLVYKIHDNSSIPYKELITASTDKKEILDLIRARKLATFQPTPGAQSPEFEFLDIKGAKESLKNLRGKLVYIDVWATWCGPCLAQIPSLKKVEKEYEKKGVAFVSISIDEPQNHNKWLNMVQDKELSGFQWKVENAWNSSFVQAYKISGIPRFILLDKNGVIIDPDAPRPSDPSLKNLLDQNI